jgi:hypothetical protein
MAASPQKEIYREMGRDRTYSSHKQKQEKSREQHIRRLLIKVNKELRKCSQLYYTFHGVTAPYVCPGRITRGCFFR